MNGESELPEGWVSTELFNLISISSGKYIKANDYSKAPTKPYPVAGAGGPIGWTEEYNVSPPVIALGRVGAAGSLNVYSTPAWVTDNTLIIEPFCDDTIPWIISFLKTVNWSNIQTGTSQPLINQTIVKSLYIPLPPLTEQRRIVAAAEQLLARVNASRERLDRVPGLLKAFRQVVLAAACSGRLTEGWREGEENLEPMSLFLKKTYVPKKVARGNFRLKQLDPSKLPILPKLWEWHHIHKVAERVTVGYVGPMKDEYVSEGIPFLRSQNVRGWGFDPSGLIFITKEFHEKIKKSALEPRDLVIVRSGNVGTACIIPDNLTEANCSDLVIVKQPFGFISEYGAYFLNSVAKSEIDASKVGIALSHFNTQSVANLPMPIPPLPEQHEIVRRVEALFAIADRIEQRVAVGKERADRLTQAILAKAFRGELVPTEAELARSEGREYEPAGVLLERIGKEREIGEGKKKSVRKGLSE